MGVFVYIVSANSLFLNVLFRDGAGRKENNLV